MKNPNNIPYKEEVWLNNNTNYLDMWAEIKLFT